MNSEYASQNAYDAISIHGGSGFIMEYKSQRLYRDARIFSIYEGTTQLQVVAAIRYVTNGTYLQVIRDMTASTPDSALKNRIAPLVDLYEKAVNYVKEQGNQEVHDFLARRLYDMTAELIMSLLIIDDAERAEGDLKQRFTESANVYVRMTEEEVCAKSYYVMHFSEADLVNFRAK